MSTLEYPPGKVNMVSEEKKINYVWFQWFIRLYKLVLPLNEGFTGSITTAPLTGGGTPGSMTFVNGVVTAQTAAT